jgi:hypothetical protein
MPPPGVTDPRRVTVSWTGIYERTHVLAPLINSPMQTHIDETVLEDAARFGLLESPLFHSVRAHVGECLYCRDRLAEMDEFDVFLRTSCEEDISGSVTIKRETPAGTAFLLIEGNDVNGWDARAIGAGSYQTRTFVRGSDARAWLEEWFRRTF